MPKGKILLTAGLSSLITLILLAGILLIFSRALAAPTHQNATSPTYVSVSALAFSPLDHTSPFVKNTARQMLSLDSQFRNLDGGNNIFVAPLTLPDQARLTGMDIFGEDFDNQGAILVRFKRCEHSLGRCQTLTQATSLDPFNIGRFGPAGVVPLLNEIIDNNVYSYLLELELTALGNSGLRSVRLELFEGPVAGSPPPAPANTGERWELAGNSTSFFIPNNDLNQIRICTDDLSNLPNPTHYPVLIVDGQFTPLTGNSCVTVSGRNIEVRRPISAGPSAGTYQILR
jgi:hypothetical protein